MVLSNGEINIIADMEGTTGVKLHNNRQKLRARFDIQRKLGQGTYGKVQLAVNKDTGEEVAIKTIKKSKIETEQDLIRIQREIQIMSSVQHPHIIHIYEVFENKEKIVLVMEYASGGELYDYLSFKKVLVESEARRVFRQVASAVFYCHKNMICHRDLKLENILLDERGNAKIADFGLSNVFDERNFLSTFCGSPLYASPEIVRGTPYYGPEVDCWSLGVLLYTLVYGAMPFDGSNFKRLVKQISEGDYYEPRVPSEASGLIRKMLTVDPAKRATVDDICCDRWVDIGESVPLLEHAEELCKRMPVRLDYLLALTAAPPPEELENAKNATTVTDQGPTSTDDGRIGHADDEEDAEQWERPALQALSASDVRLGEPASPKSPDAPDVAGKDSGKKHPLASSSSAVDDAGSARVQHKKQRGDEAQPMDDGAADDDDDRGGGAEKVSAPPVDEPAESSGEAMESGPVEKAPTIAEAPVASSETNHSERSGEHEMFSVADRVTRVPAESVLEPQPATEGDSNVEKEAVVQPPPPSVGPAESAEPSAEEPKQATDKGVTKRRTWSVKKPASPSVAGLANGTVRGKKGSPSEVPTEGVSASKTVGNGLASTAVSKVPKLRKSVSVTKEAAAPVGPEALTPPSVASEKRKLAFPAVKVSDAKKSFESKPAEKKPLVLPGMRVSSVKKSFESQPSTPEAASPPVKPLTKSATCAANGVANKGPIAKSASLSRNEIADQKSIEAAEQSKPPSRIVPRLPSPTKRDVKGAPTAAEPAGHHHRTCVPAESKTVAAQEAKRSPPKSLAFKRRSPPAAVPSSESPLRKNSVSKIGSPATKPAAKEKEAAAPPASATRRPSAGGRAGSTLGSRPRSPTKAFKGKGADATIPSPGLPPKLEAEVANDVADVEPVAAQVPQADSRPAAVVVEEPTVAAAVEKSASEATLPAEEHLPTPVVGHEKRGSIEIAPLPESALVRRYSDEAEGVGSPVVRFLPKQKSGLVLLGVKSEVLFDVASGEPRQLAVEPVPTPEADAGGEKKKPEDAEEDSKIIRYIATVRRHGSTDDQLDDGPERVTLLDLRCSASGDVTSKLTPKSGIPERIPDSPGTPSEETAKALSPTAPKNVQEQFSDRTSAEEDGVGPEQRGYSMYRSKYRSIQKYRSVVERRQDGGDDEKIQVKSEAAEGRAPSVERCDSFSSAGSADDLEDVFESLTSESLFTSLLSRTRNLIERLTEGDVGATRWFQSSLLGRSGASIPSLSTSSFLFNSPSLSFRLTPGTSSHPSSYRISASSGPSITAGRNLRRHHRTAGYESDAANYASDTCSSSGGVGASTGSPRWKYSRSVNRSSADDDDDVAFMSDTGGSGSTSSRLRSNINFRSRSSYSNYDSNRSVSLSASLRAKENLASTAGRQSRYEAFRSQEPSGGLSAHARREDARSDVISALLRHRNRSLDAHRPHSFYDPDPAATVVGKTSPSGSGVGGSRFSQAFVSDADREPASSPYGTTRRPSKFQRYSKSVTKELSEEYDSEESSGLHRPRSVLVLSDSKDEPKGSSVSVSRDYSRNVSCSGGTECEEEEEFEREHQVTEGGGRVTTLRRECKRTVSQTKDSDVPDSPAVHQPVKKQGSDDRLSRQDSGLGSSMYESAPSTPTSAGVQPRKGFLKFSHSVSNELEALEEEMNKMGQSREGGQANGEAAAARSTDGTVTPPSDSAETGSVCSDTGGQQQKASSEEESVGERIRRKSFFARFNESRIPGRKGRKTSPAGADGPSVRSELGRTSSLRHRHHYYDDEPSYAGGRTFFDPSAELYGRHGNQRWSTHFSDSDFLYSPGDGPGSASCGAPRRRSSGGSNPPDVLSFLRRGTSSAADAGPAYGGGDDGCEPGVMYRTHSLPEEPSPPSRPVFRQHSMPGTKSADGVATDGTVPQARRPSRLRLRTTNYPDGSASCEETGETSGTEPPRTWRAGRSRAAGFLDPLEAWGTTHPRSGASFAALMDSLESPSEVLQKAMDLCDSLRFS